MSVADLLDKLDDLVDDAWSLPLSGGKTVVDAEKIRDLLDDIRINILTNNYMKEMDESHLFFLLRTFAMHYVYNL